MLPELPGPMLDLLSWLVRQSVVVLPVGLLALALNPLLGRRPRWMLALWTAVLIRLCVPATMGVLQMPDLAHERSTHSARLSTVETIASHRHRPATADLTSTGSASSGDALRTALFGLWVLGAAVSAASWLRARRSLVKIDAAAAEAGPEVRALLSQLVGSRQSRWATPPALRVSRTAAAPFCSAP